MDNLKSMTQVWVSLGRQFDVHPRSIETFVKRVEGEGRQFLYKDLSQLGRDFNRSLIGGESFNTTARFGLAPNGLYPKFLSELFSQVIDNEGLIKLDASATIIQRIRQLTLLYYKVKVPHDEITVLEAVRSFVERDRGLDRPLPPEAASRKATKLIGRLLRGLDPFSTVPRHSSGSTSCRTPNCDKYHSFRFIPRLHAVFPYECNFFLTLTHLTDSLESLLECEVIEDPPARIVAVPKDMRGPRLICCEPREHQFIQQGLMRALYKRVENHYLTKGYVNFTDQEVNRELTLKASETQEWATLDLKDASDRVRWDLVQRLFPLDWVVAFDACRTRFVETGGETTYGPMRKFAPMGSSVCFPVEALVFWSLLHSHLGCEVFVYGDDIILPTARAEEAIHILEYFDLKVNVQKSCYKTPFRESCGIDCWNGHDVSYVKASMEFDTTRKSVKTKRGRKLYQTMASFKSEISWVDFVNNLAETFDWDLGNHVRGIVDEAFGPHYCTTRGLPLTYRCGYRSSNMAFFVHNYNEQLQRWEALLPDVDTLKTACRTEDEFARNELFRLMLTGWNDTHVVGEYAEPNRIRKKYRWRPI